MSLNLRDEQFTLEGLTSALTVAVVSDIHLKTRRSKRTLRKVIDTINERDVDLVFLLGDYVQNTTKNLKPLDALAELESRYGVYAVLGNHDYRMNWPSASSDTLFADGISAVLWSAGVTVLRDDSATIRVGDDVLNIVGLESHWCGADVDSAYSYVDSRLPTILLAHDPDAIVCLDDYHRTDLMLAGHTHGYMLRTSNDNVILPFIPTKQGREYDHGFKTYEERDMFITSGLGHIGGLPRINNPSEVVFFEFVPQ